MTGAWTPSPEEMDSIITWTRKGTSLNEVGGLLGISGRTLQRYMKRDREFAAEIARARDERGIADHGTPSRYSYWGCRCDVCKRANTRRSYRIRVERGDRLAEAPHGTVSAYVNWGCRCEPCKQAGSEQNAMQRNRRKRGAS